MSGLSKLCLSLMSFQGGVTTVEKARVVRPPLRRQDQEPGPVVRPASQACNVPRAIIQSRMLGSQKS